jgi:cytochrome c oxidase subunit 2
MKKMNLCPGIAGMLLIVLIISTGYNKVCADQQEQVIKMTAKRFEYSPHEITLKKGVPVVLEITALDRLHGFFCPDLKLRADLLQGKVIRIRVVPYKTGAFAFHCDIVCGDGHENMVGTITVKE